MEISETVSVRRFREFSARQKHELYETLLELADTIDELPKKSLRKTLELTLAVLEYKGQLAQKFEQSGERRLQDENEKLKRMVQKLEAERDGLKLKNKELSAEIKQQQEELRQATQQAEASDKDSSDPLSELEKQEHLLHNIEAKNKHIKRLLREIDVLQNQNIAQSKTIAVHEQELQQIRVNLQQLSQDITKVEQERKALKHREQQQCVEIARLEGNVTFLEEERDKQDAEMRQFLDNYDNQVLNWRQVLEQKDKELEQLRKRIEQLTSGQNTVDSTESSSQSAQNEELTNLRHILESRDKCIEALEEKLQSMSEEMINSTKIMNQLCLQHENTKNPQQPRPCCQLIEERLRVVNARLQQLSELLDVTEQDNVLKAKQALHALNALEAYKRGEDGLMPALRRCSALEQKLAERDKQLRIYTQELNAMHELEQENSVLRRRLNIPDDAVVLSKHVRAKQRNKDKQIERLTLKLRTSEEHRLQLKLDKCELRRKLLELQNSQPEKLDEPVYQPSEVGELPPSAPLENSPCRGQGDGAASSELQTKYEDVLAENETLRMGMYEILEKLREYDATSDHITIDPELLQRLLEALPSSASIPHLSDRLQQLRAREEVLCQLLHRNTSEAETGELSSVQSIQDVSDMPEEQPDILAIDTVTRPTTPTDVGKGVQLPVITELEVEQLRPTTAELGELSILRKHYDELRVHMAADANELLQYNQELHEQVLCLEKQLQAQNSSYSFMREEFDQLLSEQRRQELRHIEQTAQLQKQLEQLKFELAAKSEQLDAVQRTRFCSSEELLQLEQRNATLSMQLAQAIEQLLGQLKVPDICADYGIIDDNYQLDYVTAAEFDKQRQTLNTWMAQQSELQRENKQLEGLLQVANGQIQSQQKLLNEITDNHINLRHLVADLQSSSNDKLQLAKMQRDLDAAKAETSRLELERKHLQQDVENLNKQLHAAERLAAQMQHDFQLERNNSDVKQKFLQRSLFTLKEKYAKFTPLIFLNNFVFSYQKLNKRVIEQLQAERTADHSTLVDHVLQEVQAKLAPNEENSQQLIKLIKSETQSRMLEQRCESLQARQAELEQELNDLRLQHAAESEHWQTIEALFAEPNSQSKSSTAGVDAATNTETVAPVPAMRRATQFVDRQSSPIGSPSKRLSNHDTTTQTENVPVMRLETAVQTNGSSRARQLQQTQGQSQHQGVQTVQDEELQQMRADLLAANKRIEELEKQLEANTNACNESDSQHSGVVEKTILSFHTLLLEKDQSIQKYQDLLQTEREQSQLLVTKQTAENETLKATVNNLNFNIKTKDLEIIDLKAKLELHKVPVIRVNVQGTEHALNELTDERIEELFEHSSVDRNTHPQDSEDHEDVELVVAVASVDVDEAAGEQEKQDTEELKELPTLHKQIKELKEKLSYFEQSLITREEEVEILREKLKLCQDREKCLESSSNPELEQLRVFLEEKDKHIRDLMETLKNFHDDQQRYINDTSNYSADQIAKLAADLNRTEATNKIYHTQMEALRRQLANVTQREKQARDLSQSLRQQLLKRPVVSIKTELNARVKNENLQKRIQQLEVDLDDSRAQLQRQQTLLEAKRTRSANEVGLWEKQKRWQQQADKFKSKLEETELALEKTRTLLQAARTTIGRLEKDKHLLEAKLGKAGGAGGTSTTAAANTAHNSLKCCRAPSCPNLQHVGATKFTSSPSESPETYTGASSECSSPTNNHNQSQPNSRHQSFYEQGQSELIEALKARIEMQQRKIIAMELEGRGTNALTTELEKLQERCQSIEAQNIRLEARNLQLQLDMDLLRQGDSSDRLQKRIKHLEDYILALKEEMARTESRRVLCKCSGLKVNTQQGQSAEHTILSLRNLVEKLRSENKYLKDARGATDLRGSGDSMSASAELVRVQQLHAESLKKIATLQQELKQRCNDGKGDALKYIKEQLTKKTQLLQKAKVLLTRAAAKEKVLREQIAVWKRKCSELQNVPVIDEISE